MSHITKYLKQKCEVCLYKSDSEGLPELNQFGEIQYGDPIVCRCRHEIAYQDVQVANGSIVKSSSRYFLDEALEIKADYLIDRHVVLSVSSFVNQFGRVEGYEVYV